MLNRLRQALPEPSLGLALCMVVVIGTGVYAAEYRDPFVVLVMAPFFVLGCAPGKRPLLLLALSSVPGLILLATNVVKRTLTGMPLANNDHHFLRQNVLMLAQNDCHVPVGFTCPTPGFDQSQTPSGKIFFRRDTSAAATFTL